MCTPRGSGCHERVAILKRMGDMVKSHPKLYKSKNYDLVVDNVLVWCYIIAKPKGTSPQGKTMKGRFKTMAKEMTVAEKIQAVREFNARLTAEAAKGSTGWSGKQCDFDVRDFVLARGVRRLEDVRCRAAGKADWTIRINGKLYRGETKTNMGEWKVPCARISADDIFPGVDYVVYAAEVDNITKDNLPDMMFVFTRAQFIELLTVTGRKGLESSLRYNAKRGTVGIQAWSVYNKKTAKWVCARLNKYYDYLEANNIPTLRDWVEAVRG